MQVTAGPCEAAVSTAISRRHQAKPVEAEGEAAQLPPSGVEAGNGKARKPSIKPTEAKQGSTPATQLLGLPGAPGMAAKQVSNLPVQALCFAGQLQPGVLQCGSGASFRYCVGRSSLARQLQRCACCAAGLDHHSAGHYCPAACASQTLFLASLMQVQTGGNTQRARDFSLSVSLSRAQNEMVLTSQQVGGHSGPQGCCSHMSALCCSSRKAGPCKTTQQKSKPQESLMQWSLTSKQLARKGLGPAPTPRSCQQLAVPPPTKLASRYGPTAGLRFSCL